MSLQTNKNTSKGSSIKTFLFRTLLYCIALLIFKTWKTVWNASVIFEMIANHERKFLKIMLNSVNPTDGKNNMWLEMSNNWQVKSMHRLDTFSQVEMLQTSSASNWHLLWHGKKMDWRNENDKYLLQISTYIFTLY